MTAGEALGRSRGGLSTKIHLGVDGRGRPLSILISPGQAGDNPYLLPALDAIAVRRARTGRARKRPDLLLADRGYAHDSTRTALRRRGIPHAIPERRDQIARRAAKGPAGGLYRFRTRRRSCDLRFGWMSGLRQDRGLCPFASCI